MTHLLLISAVILAPQAKPVVKIDSVADVVVSAGDFRVELEAEFWDPKGHRVVYRKGVGMYVDGVSVDGYTPRTTPKHRLTAVKAWYKGRRLSVPSRLWQGIYDPHFSMSNTDFREYLVSRVTDNRLCLRIDGGDGERSYAYEIFISRDNRHWRRRLITM